jgi:hypothetical protein
MPEQLLLSMAYSILDRRKRIALLATSWVSDVHNMRRAVLHTKDGIREEENNEQDDTDHEQALNQADTKFAGGRGLLLVGGISMGSWEHHQPVATLPANMRLAGRASGRRTGVHVSHVDSCGG